MALESSILQILIFVLVIIIIIIWIQSNKRIAKKNSELKKLKKEGSERKKLIEKIDSLQKENEDLSKTIRNIKFQLIKTAKGNHDLNKIISSLDEKIQKLGEKDNAKNIPINDVLRILGKKVPETQDTFQIHMDDINQQYIQKLKKLFPKLTMYDLRLCTYIKTGLSTREIAEMMNVLPSSINVSRSRLRKKLELESKDDLFTFLENLM